MDLVKSSAISAVIGDAGRLRQGGLHGHDHRRRNGAGQTRRRGRRRAGGDTAAYRRQTLHTGDDISVYTDLARRE
jgi:hypothetical protein